MQTGAISFRVADFLKQFPPFQFMEHSDLLALAGRGRVRFHEADEFLLWQGSPHGDYLPVIQQGTVSLLEAKDGREILRDIVGPGDILGIDRLSGSQTSRYSARSQSEVVVYALPGTELERLLEKYPQAAEYIGAQATGSSSYQHGEGCAPAHQVRLTEIAVQQNTTRCQAGEAVRELIRRIAETDADAAAIFGPQDRFFGVVTAQDILRSLGDGVLGLDSPVESLVRRGITRVSAEATVADAVLAMAESHAGVVVVEQEGTPHSPPRLITPADLASTFGDQPEFILRDIARAADPAALRAVHSRVQHFVLGQMTSPAAVDWLSRLSDLAARRILARVIAWNPPPEGDWCWCFFGPAGRQESLSPILPGSVLLLQNAPSRRQFVAWYERILEALKECGYLAAGSSFEADFCCAEAAEWQARFQGWIQEPVFREMYQARPLFDLRPVASSDSAQAELWEALNRAVLHRVREERDFLPLLAHDCLANLPPITFFRGLVIDESGGQAVVFQLRQSALLPLVDVGRVFGLRAGAALSCSTLERFGMAGQSLPEQAQMFSQACETLRTVLALQARVGIRQQSAGFELPPSLLSHYDRQVLKRGFHSILHLLEFTQSFAWSEPS